jgi:hypothetical protein
VSISLVGTPSLVQNSTGDPITGAFGSGQNRSVGNLLVALVGGMSSGGSGAVTLFSGSGWTKQFEGIGTQAPAGTVASIWTKAATGGDAAPGFSCQLSGTREGDVVVLYELTDSGGTTPVVDTGGNNAGSTANPLAGTTNASVTASGGFGLAVALNGLGTIASSNTWGAVTGWSQAFKDANNNTFANGFGHYVIGTNSAPASGSTLTYNPTYTYTSNAPTTECIALIVIKPGVAAGSATMLSATLIPPGRISPASFGAPRLPPSAVIPQTVVSPPRIDGNQASHIQAIPPGLISPAAWSGPHVTRPRMAIADPLPLVAVHDSDTAAFADAVVSVGVSDSDSGEGVPGEAQSLTVCPATQESAAGSDAFSGSFGVSAATDTGSASDSGTIGLTSTDAGSAAESSTISVPVSDSDTGSLTDALVSVAPQGSDTGSGVDFGQVVTLINDTDSGTFTDASGAFGITAAADTASAADSAATQIGAASADTGSAADAQHAGVSSADTAAAADTGSVTASPSDADTGSLTEAAHIAVSSADTGSGIEQAPFVAVSQDQGAFSAETARIGITSTEAAAAADAAYLGVTQADSLTGLDQTGVLAVVAADAGAFGSETATVPFAIITDADYGSFTESGTRPLLITIAVYPAGVVIPSVSGGAEVIPAVTAAAALTVSISVTAVTPVVA